MKQNSTLIATVPTDISMCPGSAANGRLEQGIIVPFQNVPLGQSSQEAEGQAAGNDGETEN